MRVYDAFFFGTLFFLVGVLAESLPAGETGAGIQNTVWWAVLGGIVSALSFWYAQGRGWKFNRWGRSGWLAVAALLFFVPAGAFYYAVDDARFNNPPLPVGEGTFHARVVSHPTTKDGVQELVVKIEGSTLRLLARLPPYPKFSYGDRVSFSGRIEEPFSDTYETYLAKERIRGVVAFPKIFMHESGGRSFRGALYALRGRIVDVFRRTLPAKEAALMAGITVGAREDFSEEFRDAMAKSGTTHITALSGYNISVVIEYVLMMLLLFLPRRAAFAGTLMVVLAFVLMTGAEASVVRAAIMGGVVLFAAHAGRARSIRNVILFAALIMVLANPKVLAFDLGFQLSFLALLGIVYLKPTLDRALGWETMSCGTVFSWRENLTTTAAAQLAVAPLLIRTFGSVSVSSLAANLLVLEVVPLTMAFGFVLAGISLVSLFLAKLVGFAALVLLKFQTVVIEVFAQLAIPISASFSLALTTMYYAAIIAFIAFYHVRNRQLVSRRI